jgi:hypothetical protein
MFTFPPAAFSIPPRILFQPRKSIADQATACARVELK